MEMPDMWFAVSYVDANGQYYKFFAQADEAVAQKAEWEKIYRQVSVVTAYEK